MALKLLKAARLRYHLPVEHDHALEGAITAPSKPRPPAIADFEMHGTAGTPKELATHGESEVKEFPAPEPEARRFQYLSPLTAMYLARKYASSTETVTSTS